MPDINKCKSCGCDTISQDGKCLNCHFLEFTKVFKEHHAADAESSAGLALVMWQPDNAQYCSGDDGMVGKWKAFNVYYDSARSKDDPKVYKLKCLLPGIKNDLGNFEKQEEAKVKAEIVLNLWLDKANLQAI